MGWEVGRWGRGQVGREVGRGRWRGEVAGGGRLGEVGEAGFTCHWLFEGFERRDQGSLPECMDFGAVWDVDHFSGKRTVWGSEKRKPTGDYYVEVDYSIYQGSPFWWPIPFLLATPSSSQVRHEV